MFNRRQSGATLALNAALILLICLIGVALFYLLRVMGGSRELQHATDSGSLSVAKNALTGPTISLNNGVETNNFSGLADQNGNVDLLTYNRLMGQTLLVALNASAEGTKDATANATTLINSMHSDNNNISQRLSNALNNWADSNSSFSSLAQSYSTRMLDNATVQQQTGTGTNGSYEGKGATTNVYIDPSILPSGVSLPDGALSDVKSNASGQNYINGYTDITVAAAAKQAAIPPLSGATVHPQEPPHLIASSTFQSSATNPVTAGSVPPNAFQSSSKVLIGQSSQATDTGKSSSVALNSANPQLTAAAYSVVGSLNKDYPACIPHGYIMVYNLPGDSNSGQLPSKDSIYNNQLFTGIFMANNGVFSTDESLIQAWADYNNGGQKGQAPSTTGLFNSSGTAVSGEQNKITSLGGNGYPVMADYTNIAGPNANAAAVAMVPAFEAAYPAPLATGSSSATLTAVEKLKAEVLELYASGVDGDPAAVHTTGMRVFDHTKAYPLSAGQTPQFTRPGNITELCMQANPANNGNAVLDQIRQRMREIKPSATDTEMNAILSSQTVDLGQTFYIWLDSNSNTFQMTQAAPTWVTGYLRADGNPDTHGVSFPTIGLSVDPVGECGFNQTLFAGHPNPATTDRGVDQANFTPSSGFDNLLAKVSFDEYIGDTSSTVGCTPDPCVVLFQEYLALVAYDNGGTLHNGWFFWAGMNYTTLKASSFGPAGTVIAFVPPEISNYMTTTRIAGDMFETVWNPGVKTCSPPHTFWGQN